MPRRSLPKRIGWTLRDYAKRVWDNAGEDNIFFLAGGVSFNLLLAAVPFVLLLFAALGYILDQTAADATSRVWLFIERLLPPHAERADSPLHKLINEIIAARGTVGLFGAIAFVWFSTRLFGSLPASSPAAFPARLRACGTHSSPCWRRLRRASISRTRSTRRRMKTWRGGRGRCAPGRKPC